MKWIYNIKRVSIAFVCILALQSCEDFLDVNTDPNNASESSVQLTFTPGVSSVAYTLGGVYQVTGAMWSQHWTQSTGASQYRSRDAYDIQSDFMTRQYLELYAGGLNDLQYVKETATAAENWNYVLMSEVMQAYTFQILADLYDQVPYSEALQKNANFTPKFDTGAEIYAGLLSKIDEALALDLAASSNVAPGPDDILFGGNMAGWTRFANSLKLKILMRQSGVSSKSSSTTTGLTSLFTGGSDFISSDVAMTAFGSGQNQRNPFFETEVSRFGNVNVAASNTFLNHLQSTSDPRLSSIFDQVSGSYVGLDQGNFFAASPTNATGISQPIIGAQAPVYLMSLAEVRFLQAEAILRFPGETGLTDADAQSMYEAGIEASLAQHGVGGGASLYGAGEYYEWTGTAENKMRLIGESKWVAFANTQGLEAFFEQQRTGYPDFFVAPVNSVLGATARVKRLLFPSTEDDRNPENTPSLIPITTPIWWGN